MLAPIVCNAFYRTSFYGLSVADLDCINKHFAWRVMQQLEMAPMSDSPGIKLKSLYMSLLNDNEVTFIMDFMCTLWWLQVFFYSLGSGADIVVYCAAFCILCTIS